ncbi:hypothetical protein, partial [Roseovarius tolerans]
LIPGAALIVLAIAIGNGLFSRQRTGLETAIAGHVCIAGGRERCDPVVRLPHCNLWLNRVKLILRSVCAPADQQATGRLAFPTKARLR